MKPVVYALKSDKADKLYIGSSKDLDRRVQVHMSTLRRGTHQNKNLQKAWDEFSDIYVHTVIECGTVEDAQKLEVSLIGKFLLMDRCFNINTGVSGGDALTHHPDREEIIKRRSASQVEANSKMSEEERAERWSRPGELNPMFGRKHSEESIKAMSEALKGKGLVPWNKGGTIPDHVKKVLSEKAKERVGDLNPFYGKKHSEETIRKIKEAQVGKTTGFGFKLEIDGVEYDSYYSASRILNIPLPTIRWRCNSDNPKFSNYKLLSKCPTTSEST